MKRLAKLTTLIATTAMTTLLSGCIVSDEPFPSTELSMSLPEVRQLMSDPDFKIGPARPGSDWEQMGYLLWERDEGDTIPIRFLPTRKGIVVEVPPTAWGQPFFLYAGILPHPQGLAVYVDEFGLSSSQQGNNDQPHALRAWRAVQHRFTPRALGGFPIVEPHDVEAVIDAYVALAAGGLRPQGVFSVGGS